MGLNSQKHELTFNFVEHLQVLREELQSSFPPGKHFPEWVHAFPGSALNELAVETHAVCGSQKPQGSFQKGREFYPES